MAIEASSSLRSSVEQAALHRSRRLASASKTAYTPLSSATASGSAEHSGSKAAVASLAGHKPDKRKADGEPEVEKVIAK